MSSDKEAERQRVENALARVHTVAHWLDEAFEIPVIRRRVGLDPLIGLIPTAGDWLTWVPSIYILLEGMRLKLPVSMLGQMAFNIAIDLLIGVFPLIGDLADFGIKANRKNADMMLRHCRAKVDGDKIRFTGDPATRETSSALTRWTATAFLITCLAALVAIPIALIAWLISALG